MDPITTALAAKATWDTGAYIYNKIKGNKAAKNEAAGNHPDGTPMTEEEKEEAADKKKYNADADTMRANLLQRDDQIRQARAGRKANYERRGNSHYIASQLTHEDAPDSARERMRRFNTHFDPMMSDFTEHVQRSRKRMAEGGSSLSKMAPIKELHEMYNTRPKQKDFLNGPRIGRSFNDLEPGEEETRREFGPTRRDVRPEDARRWHDMGPVGRATYKDEGTLSKILNFAGALQGMPLANAGGVMTQLAQLGGGAIGKMFGGALGGGTANAASGNTSSSAVAAPESQTQLHQSEIDAEAAAKQKAAEEAEAEKQRQAEAEAAAKQKAEEEAAEAKKKAEQEAAAQAERDKLTAQAQAIRKELSTGTGTSEQLYQAMLLENKANPGTYTQKQMKEAKSNAKWNMREDGNDASFWQMYKNALHNTGRVAARTLHRALKKGKDVVNAVPFGPEAASAAASFGGGLAAAPFGPEASIVAGGATGGVVKSSLADRAKKKAIKEEKRKQRINEMSGE